MSEVLLSRHSLVLSIPSFHQHRIFNSIEVQSRKMKFLILLSVLCVAVQFHGVTAGVRVVRDTDTPDDKANPGTPDFGKILAGALRRIRAKTQDPQIQMDVDKVQMGLESGQFKETLQKVRSDIGEKFDLPKVIAALKANAPPEYKAEVERITTAAQGALEKFHGRIHEHAGRLEERLKAAADSVAAESA